jgi:hypothetical protein
MEKETEQKKKRNDLPGRSHLPKPSKPATRAQPNIPIRSSSSSVKKQLGGELQGVRSAAASPTLEMKAAAPYRL